MRNWKVWGVLGLLLALVLAVGYGQETIPVPPTMQQVYQQLMQQVSQLMTSAARELGVLLPDSTPIPGMVYAARAYDDIVWAGAPVRDLERVTLQDLSRGAILGVVYLQLPARLGSPTTTIPAGFYKMRVFTLPTPIPIGAPNARAQFIDKTGRVVMERPATVGTSEPPTVGAKFTAEIGDNEICGDVHWGRFKVKVCIEW
jgi:hypothetical protein